MKSGAEILRAASVLIETGWSQGAQARDGNGVAVPLYRGDIKAGINPDAVSFSIYGAICKAIATTASGPFAGLPLIWNVLHKLASATETPHGGTNYVHPVIQFNEAEGRTKAEVLALLDLAAIECDRIGDGPFEPPVAAPVEAGRAS